MNYADRIMQFHLAELEGLTAEEKVVYLRDMLHAEIGARHNRVARCIDSIPGGTTRQVAWLLIVLSDAPGRTLTYEHIAASMEFMSGSYHTLSSIQTAAKHARAALRKTGWPVTVETAYGVGYRLTVRQGWVPPWTLPPPSAGIDRSHWIRSGGA